MVRSALKPGGVFHFNTTGSADAYKTAFTEFPYGLRFINFATVSDSPIRTTTRSGGSARWTNIASMARLRSIPHWKPTGVVVRTCCRSWEHSMRCRCPSSRVARKCACACGGRCGVITDDNMLAEWRTGPDTAPSSRRTHLRHASRSSLDRRAASDRESDLLQYVGDRPSDRRHARPARRSMMLIASSFPVLTGLAIYVSGSVALLLVIAAFYRRTGRSQSIASGAASCAALLAGMAILAAISYVAAALSPFPLLDHEWVPLIIFSVSTGAHGLRGRAPIPGSGTQR